MSRVKKGVEHKKAGAKKGHTTVESKLIEKRAKKEAPVNIGREPPKFGTRPFDAKSNPRPVIGEYNKIRPNKTKIQPIIERFYLVNEAGLFLHMSGEGFTDRKEFAFWGIPKQVEAMSNKRPEIATLRRVPYLKVNPPRGNQVSHVSEGLY